MRTLLRNRIAGLALLVVLAVLLDAWGWHRFKDLDPRFDQAGNTVVSKQLAQASHLLPTVASRVPVPFSKRLEADRKSWLRPLARTYAVEPIVMLDASSLLLNAGAMRLFAPTYSVTILVSIAASSLTAFVIFAWCFSLLPQLPSGSRSVCAATAGVLVLVCAYRFYYSPWGAHNFAVLFLTLALLACDTAMRRWSTGNATGWIALALAAIAVALYSYSSNLLIILLTLPLALFMVRGRSWPARLVAAALFVAFVLLVTLPVLITFFPPPLAGAPDPKPLIAAWHRAGSWFAAGAGYYSLPGFLLGLAGVVLLAVQRRTNLPCVMLFAHFVLWTCLRSFTWNETATGLRTFNYVLPIFALGAATLLGSVLRLERRSSVAAALLAGMLVFHFGLQMELMANQDRFARRIPLFAELFFLGQGKVHAWVAGVDAMVPQGATLLSGDAETNASFEALSQRSDLSSQDLPPLDTLWRHAQSGDVQTYLSERRRQSIPCADLYVVADRSAEDTIADVVQKAGPCGETRAAEMAHFDFPSDRSLVRPIVLYRIVSSNR